MANHKSAKKRSRQTEKKTQINKIILSKVKTALNNFFSSLAEKNIDVSKESLNILNSAYSKAVKRGVLKQAHVSRKLSSLSGQLKKIS